MMKKTKADLEREALRLIAEGKMPTFEELINTVAETREKYKPLILAARKMKDEDAE
jgi:hypothetical protein